MESNIEEQEGGSKRLSPKGNVMLHVFYRSSEQDRWQSMDFVLGYRVKRSRNHPDADICDDLSADNDDNESDRGVYPKTFVFKGWHPQCHCFVVPILASRADFIKMQKALLNGEEPPEPSGKIEEPNEYFNEWVSKNRDRIENAKTLPYWVKDNKKTIDRAMEEEDEINKEKSSKRTKNGKLQSINNIEEKSRYQANHKEYERLLADENYTDVAFNEENGGLKATHIRHNFDKKGGAYELAVQNIGFKSGHSVILGEEPQNVFGERCFDGLWDRLPFEIAGAETGTANNIRNAIKHCASKPKTEIAIIYLPNEVDAESIRSGIAKYNGLSKNKDGQWKHFRAIIFVGKDGFISQ